MSQPTDGMVGPGYLSEEPLSDNAAAPVAASNLAAPTGSRRGRLRSAHQLEPLMFALQIEQRIRGHLQRILGSHQEVSDLLQDVYLQLLIVSDRPSHTVESTTAFVMTVARNKAYDWLRRKKIAARLCPTMDIDDVEIPADDMGPDELASSEYELERLFAAIQSLPSGCRQVFLLRKVYGMSHKSIAHTVGIAVHTVEQHMTRATRQLGESLERYSPEYPLLYAVHQSVTRFQNAKRKSPRFAQTSDSRGRLLRQDRPG
jgi:RNA polymerase sigma factor (sigma-70 family)